MSISKKPSNSPVPDIIRELKASGDPLKAAGFYRFFQVFPGGYGEGDKFLGLSVPVQKKIAARYHKLCDLDDIDNLLQNEFHECRLTALFLLIKKFAKGDDALKKQAFNLYIKNLRHVNNWDLVDSSAHKIVGPWLEEKDRSILYKLAKSGDLWKERVAVIATFYFIKNHDFSDALNLCELFLSHQHDLIHKATGWMLRETGNRDRKTELGFLKKHYKIMPRTMLRYAIEKFEEPLRQKFLTGRY